MNSGNMLRLLPVELLREIGSYLAHPVLVSPDVVEEDSRLRIVSRLIDLETQEVSVFTAARRKTGGWLLWTHGRHEIAARKSGQHVQNTLLDGFRVSVKLARPATTCSISIREVGTGSNAYGPFSIAADQVRDVFFSSANALAMNRTHIIVALYSSSIETSCHIVAVHLESGRLHDLTARIRNCHGDGRLEDTIVNAQCKWMETRGEEATAATHHWRCVALGKRGGYGRFVVRVVDFQLETLPDELSITKFVAAHRTVLQHERTLVGKSHGIFFDNHKDPSRLKIMIHYSTVDTATLTDFQTTITTLSLDTGKQEHAKQISHKSSCCAGLVLDPLGSSFKIVDDRTSVFTGPGTGTLLLKDHTPVLQVVSLEDPSPYHEAFKFLGQSHHLIWTRDPNYELVVAERTRSTDIWGAAQALVLLSRQ